MGLNIDNIRYTLAKDGYIPYKCNKDEEPKLGFICFKTAYTDERCSLANSIMENYDKKGPYVLIILLCDTSVRVKTVDYSDVKHKPVKREMIIDVDDPYYFETYRTIGGNTHTNLFKYIDDLIDEVESDILTKSSCRSSSHRNNSFFMYDPTKVDNNDDSPFDFPTKEDDPSIIAPRVDHLIVEGYKKYTVATISAMIIDNYDKSSTDESSGNEREIIRRSANKDTDCIHATDTGHSYNYCSISVQHDRKDE